MNPKKVLNHFGVLYEEQHPAVSHRCVGVNCPWCGDTGKHLGVFIDIGNFHCWKCGRNGSLYKLLHKLKGISWDAYSEAAGVKPIQGTPRQTLDAIFRQGANPAKENIQVSYDVDSFPEFRDAWNLPAYLDNGHRFLERFLTQRRIPRNMLETYGCKYAISGDYFQRLIIPVPPPFMPKGESPGFVARDLTGYSTRKYLVPPRLELKDTLYYNWNFIRVPKNSGRILVVVEGVLDAWAIPYPAVAVFGKTVSDRQFNLISGLGEYFNDLILCFDGDAKLDILKMYGEFGPFFSRTKPLYLPGRHDPSDLGMVTMNHIIEAIL
jgi:hypothetical protein